MRLGYRHATVLEKELCVQTSCMPSFFRVLVTSKPFVPFSINKQVVAAVAPLSVSFVTTSAQCIERRW